MSRQTIAVSVKATKLTARALAYVVAAVGRKIAKEHRKAQTPHGKQSVRKLMGHGGDTNAIEVDTPKLFDKVARKWGVDYAIRRVGDEKYLLLFKARQADAITGCFAEYSRLELKRAKSRQTPIREQLRQAEEQVKKQLQRELTTTKKNDSEKVPADKKDEQKKDTAKEQTAGEVLDSMKIALGASYTSGSTESEDRISGYYGLDLSKVESWAAESSSMSSTSMDCAVVLKVKDGYAGAVRYAEFCKGHEYQFLI